MRVLIVDDVGYTCHFYARLIESKGHDVFTAPSGAEALRLLADEPAMDVVLTDLMMRDMDGVELFQATEKLRRTTPKEKGAQPEFILMTALNPGHNAQSRELERIAVAKQVGFKHVMFKPLNQSELIRTLEMIESAKPQPPINQQTCHVQHLAELERIVDEILASGDVKTAQSFMEQIEKQTRRVNELIFAMDTLD